MRRKIRGVLTSYSADNGFSGIVRAYSGREFTFDQRLMPVNPTGKKVEFYVCDSSFLKAHSVKVIEE